MYGISDLEHLSRSYHGLEILHESSGAIVIEGHGELHLKTFLKDLESFDNGVFFNIEAKQTPSIVSKLLSKRSEHIRWNKNYFRSKANTFDSKTTVFKAKSNMSGSKKIIFEAKRTHYIERKLFSKRTH